jgi:hypothetical protein
MINAYFLSAQQKPEDSRKVNNTESSRAHIMNLGLVQTELLRNLTVLRVTQTGRRVLENRPPSNDNN